MRFHKQHQHLLLFIFCTQHLQSTQATSKTSKACTGTQPVVSIYGDEVKPANTTRGSTKLYLPNPDWSTNSFQQSMGQLTDVNIETNKNSKFYFLHRGDRVWDVNTFDEQHRFKAAASGPIKTSTIVEVINGKVFNRYGENLLYLPHSITLDMKGNLWITDVGAHQIIKLSGSNFTHVELLLGEKLIPGSDEKHFCKPTDVVVAANGIFFVSDGYCNTRIMKFDQKGKLLSQWGHTINGESTGSLALPHSLALLESLDLICVANREKSQLLCYHAGLVDPKKTGQLVFNTSQPGPVFGVASDDMSSKIFILYRRSESSHLSNIDIFDPAIGTTVDTFIPTDGLPDAHKLATCRSSPSDACSCLVVVGLTPPSASKNQRIWMYEIHTRNRSSPYQDILA